MAIYMPGREFSLGIKSAWSLILFLQPLNSQKINFCCLSHMVSGIFIMAAQTNQTIGLSTFYHFESHVETFSSLYSPHIIVLNIYSHMLRTMQHRTIIFASTIKHNLEDWRGRRETYYTYPYFYLSCFFFPMFLYSFFYNFLSV